MSTIPNQDGLCGLVSSTSYIESPSIVFLAKCQTRSFASVRLQTKEVIPSARPGNSARPGQDMSY